MVRMSISCIDGGGFGGCSLEGRNGIRDGGGFVSRVTARTKGQLYPAVSSLTTGIQRHPVRNECQICAFSHDIDRANR